jgi:hypothetical protein
VSQDTLRVLGLGLGLGLGLVPLSSKCPDADLSEILLQGGLLLAGCGRVDFVPQLLETRCEGLGFRV